MVEPNQPTEEKTRDLLPYFGSGPSTELKETAEETSMEIIRVSWWAFLRSMLALAWGAFRHPFSITYVDLSTGESTHVSREN